MAETEVLAELLGQRQLAGAAPLRHVEKSGPAIVPVIVSIAAVGGWVWLASLIVDWLYQGMDSAAPNSPAIYSIIANGVVFSGVVVAGLVGRRWCPVSPSEAQMRIWSSTSLGLGMGAAGLLVTFGVAVFAGQSITISLSLTTAVSLLISGALTILFQTAAEELFFRGWLQPFSIRAWGQVTGLAVASITFSALHLFGGAKDPLSYLNILLAGFFFGLLALRTGGLAAPLAAHFAWNGIEQMGLGLDPNPGIGVFGSLTDFDLSGGSALGGSTEGLNASIVTTFVMLMMIVLLALWKRNRR